MRRCFMATKKQNIFEYAKKELSQDAVITCILNERDDDAKDFIQSMLGKDCPEKFEIVKVENQYCKIDVLVTIKVTVPGEDDHYEAIIIEDKTKTFLHGEQLENYINQAKKKKYREKKYQKGKVYTTIYFVLFKTGDYYFWERDIYDELQDEYIRENDWMKKENFKTYLLRDFKIFLANKESSLEYGWFKDYKTHIDGIPKEAAWCIDPEKTKKDFVERITSGEWGENNTNYAFGKADGNGDKGYELWLQGLCGPYVPKDSKEDTTVKDSEDPKEHTTVKDCYYLLPIVSLQSPKENHFIIKFNLHLNLNSNSPHGYLPLEKCKEKIDLNEFKKYQNLQKAIIEKYKEREGFKKIGFKINGKKGNRLQLFSCKMEKYYTEDYNKALEELRGKLGFLIKIATEIKKDIDSGQYDNCLLEKPVNENNN